MVRRRSVKVSDCFGTHYLLLFSSIEAKLRKMAQVKAEAWLNDIGSGDLCSPFFDSSNLLHVCFSKSAEVWQISQHGQLTNFHESGGQLSAACFDNQGALYLADFAHGGVLKAVKGQQELVVGVYEDRPLKGPNSIVCSADSVIFSDSGPLGETGLHNPTGGVYIIKSGPSGQILQPISLGNLSYPTGVASYGNLVYVAEQSQNRILRFYQEPEGVYHGSVFYQSSGGVGPSCITVDEQGSLYIGIYETCASGKSTGTVLVLSDTGKVVSTINTDGPEITGVAINSNVLYITEKSLGTIFKVNI